ncbi:DJ-1/PfpI family protein [Cryobacterium breve]|uniref:DJ-1/PfpI family protein n=1 Tax=Cryobacterium breve TaxID=1259258 RepID=A0ABY7NC07_9MICO|nr:DJ-1/PfpI family protein [Cryobacterium breve]WBM79297.1 DJ-1/PfpI family protein [Cryobacterium breve]
MSKIARRIGSITLATTLTITAFAAIAVTGLSQSSAETASAASLGAPPPGPGTEPLHGQFVVAVVLGQSGSDTADVFAPYDVLASSPDFFVYTIAASAAPAVVDGGLSVVPAHTFAEVAEGTAPTPDLVVVPAVNSPAGAEEAPAREFIATQYNAGARILGICAGSRLLAASGVLDGLRATSHWSRIAALRTSNPQVSWVTGQRYVQDGRVTTTGGVTSSIPGSLKVIADMAGDTEANRVGDSIGYPGWKLDGPTAMPIKDFQVRRRCLFLEYSIPLGATEGCRRAERWRR